MGSARRCVARYTGRSRNRARWATPKIIVENSLSQFRRAGFSRGGAERDRLGRPLRLGPAEARSRAQRSLRRTIKAFWDCGWRGEVLPRVRRDAEGSSPRLRESPRLRVKTRCATDLPEGGRVRTPTGSSAAFEDPAAEGDIERHEVLLVRAAQTQELLLGLEQVPLGVQHLEVGRDALDVARAGELPRSERCAIAARFCAATCSAR